MNPAGLLVAIVGIWLVTQTIRGGLLDRLGA